MRKRLPLLLSSPEGGLGRIFSSSFCSFPPPPHPQYFNPFLGKGTWRKREDFCVLFSFPPIFAFFLFLLLEKSDSMSVLSACPLRGREGGGKANFTPCRKKKKIAFKHRLPPHLILSLPLARLSPRNMGVSPLRSREMSAGKERGASFGVLRTVRTYSRTPTCSSSGFGRSAAKTSLLFDI